MSKLRLSIAVGDYDRVRPLVDGDERIDGVDPIFMLMEPEEIFFQAFRHEAFDICELSLSSFSLRTSRGDNPYIGVPVFTSRAFRHTAITVRTDRIKTAADLNGKRIGVPEYQLTACIWARAILEENGVDLSSVTWVRGGLEESGRTEKIALSLPPGIHLEDAPSDQSLSAMLERGELDAIVSPRIPSCQIRGDSNIGWLFADPTAAAVDYYKRTQIFPIMHLLGIKRTLAEANPWLPAALLKAFTKAKKIALAKLADTSAAKVTLPFVEDQLMSVTALMGPDYWSYGLEANKHVLDTFLEHHRKQGLSTGKLRACDLFHPSTWETSKI